MHPSFLFALVGLVAPPALAAKSAKRGLASVPNENWPDDDAIWVRPDSPLSWYYNFQWNVSAVYASLPQDQVEFVPMMWGGGSNDTNFLGNVTALMNCSQPGGGCRNITHVMSFNSPDQPSSNGGGDMAPAVAAQAWLRNLAPLRERFGVKLGLPIVGDPRGGWMDPFLKNCSRLNKDKECEFDFVPFHSFGNISVLQDRVGIFSSAYPGVPLWVVEYGYNDQDLATTQDFFNQSLAYLDSTDAVARYSWFGAFRSIVSNVGPNQGMLDPYGNLTDIGSWYLGGNATGKAAIPDDGPRSDACTAEKPCTDSTTGKNDGTDLLNGRSQGLWWTVAMSCLLPLLV